MVGAGSERIPEDLRLSVVVVARKRTGLQLADATATEGYGRMREGIERQRLFGLGTRWPVSRTVGSAVVIMIKM